jgi:hypothetical protein
MRRTGFKGADKAFDQGGALREWRGKVIVWIQTALFCVTSYTHAIIRISLFLVAYSMVGGFIVITLHPSIIKWLLTYFEEEFTNLGCHELRLISQDIRGVKRMEWSLRLTTRVAFVLCRFGQFLICHSQYLVAPMWHPGQLNLEISCVSLCRNSIIQMCPLGSK